MSASATAAAAAVAAAAAQAAAEVTRQSAELNTSTEFVAPANAALVASGVGDMTDDTAAAAAAVASDPLVAPAAPPVVPLIPQSPPPLAPVAERVTEVDTHFLRRDGGNQPAVMNSIAGLFGPGREGTAEDDDLRDHAFEEALERVRASRREIAEKAARGFVDMRAYYEAELAAARGEDAAGRGKPEGARQPAPGSVVEAVAAAAAAADGRDGRTRGGFTWDVGREPPSPRASHDRGDRGGVRDSVWPEPWKGSYSPPREHDAAAPPYPLPRSWASPANDRAPENPPDVQYPHEAAAAAAALAAAVAAQQRHDGDAVHARDDRREWSEDSQSRRRRQEDQGPSHDNPAPDAPPPRGSFNASTAFVDVHHAPDGSMQPPHARTRLPAVDADDQPGGAFDKEVGTLQQEVKRLRADLAASERREAAAERAMTAAEDKAEAARLKLRDAAARLQARDAEIMELGRQSVVLKEGGAAATSEAEENARKLAAATAAVARITNELTEQRHRREALERSAGELTAAVEAVKRENITLSAKLARAQDDVGRLKVKLAAAEEREAEHERMKGRLAREGEVARREGQMLRMHNQKGAQENTAQAAALQAAKQEIAELRQRCAHLEKMALVAATGQANPTHSVPHRFQHSPGRVKPEQARIISSVSHLPAASSASEDVDASPRNRKRWEVPAEGRPTEVPTSLPAWGVENHENHLFDEHPGDGMVPKAQGSRRDHVITGRAPELDHSQEDHLDDALVPAAEASRRDRVVTHAVGTDRSQDDHVGRGMVPTAAASRREGFAGAFGGIHAGKDTASHLGAGMVPMAVGPEEDDPRSIEARRPATARERTDRSAPGQRPVSAPSGTAGVSTDRSADRYSAAEAARRQRDGSGWYGGVLEPAAELAPPPPPPRDDAPPPWAMPGEIRVTGNNDRVRPGTAPARPRARPNDDDAPFATAESFASWSSHVAQTEARLMQLSMEKDTLEGELARMPNGAGKTIEQRRRKTQVEQRLADVSRAQSVARHQLKSANRMHLVGS